MPPTVPAVIPSFKQEGSVENVLIASPYDNPVSKSVEKIKLLAGEGVVHDNHCNASRWIDVRDKTATGLGITKGTQVFNHRQWSAVSHEELADIAKEIGIPQIDPGLLGENLVIFDIPRFSKLPIGTQLFFRSNDGTLRSTILMVTGENQPCQIPGDAIAKQYCEMPIKNISELFVRYAVGRRGVVGIVISGGVIKASDRVIVVTPKQHLYELPEERPK